MIQGSRPEIQPNIRKPVFGVCDQVSLKPACSASEASKSLEILDLASISSEQQRRGCEFFACGITE